MINNKKKYEQKIIIIIKIWIINKSKMNKKIRFKILKIFFLIKIQIETKFLIYINLKVQQNDKLHQVLKITKLKNLTKVVFIKVFCNYLKIVFL